MDFGQLKSIFEKPLTEISFPKEKEQKCFLMHHVMGQTTKVKDGSKKKKGKNRKRIEKIDESNPKNIHIRKNESNDDNLSLPERNIEKIHKWPSRVPLNKLSQRFPETNTITRKKNQEDLDCKIPGHPIRTGLIGSRVNEERNVNVSVKLPETIQEKSKISKSFVKPENLQDAPGGADKSEMLTNILGVQKEFICEKNVQNDSKSVESHSHASNEVVGTGANSYGVSTGKEKWKNECLQILAQTSQLAEEVVNLKHRTKSSDNNDIASKNNERTPRLAVSSRKRKIESFQLAAKQIENSKPSTELSLFPTKRECIENKNIEIDTQQHLLPAVTRLPQRQDPQQHNVIITKGISENQASAPRPNTRSQAKAVKQPPKAVTMNLRKRTPGLTLAEQEKQRMSKNFYRQKRKIEQERESEIRRIDKQKPCVFYKKHGFCDMGDSCRFSHEHFEKTKELCKYYLRDACLMGEKCIYMHGDWPCRFFHLKSFCYAGEECRFSHAQLTDTMRELLQAKDMADESNRIEEASTSSQENTINNVKDSDITPNLRRQQQQQQRHEDQTGKEENENVDSKTNFIKTGDDDVGFQFSSFYSDLS